MVSGLLTSTTEQEFTQQMQNSSGEAELIFFFFNKQESILLVLNHKNAMSSEVKGREDNWFALGLRTEKLCGR